MVQVTTGVRAQEVLQRAGHTLFVEGTRDSLDVKVLELLLAPMLRVEPLGPSFSVRSVATALHTFHPEYWFIIDRDAWDDEAVEDSWRKFPDPGEHNLLIWRRKELENYFIEPAWVCRSKFFREGSTEEELRDWLTERAMRRLWLEAANRVLIRKRETIKQSKISLLNSADLEGLQMRDTVKRALVERTAQLVHTSIADELSREFDREVILLSGSEPAGQDPSLAWGAGKWLELMPAKTLFNDIVNRWMKVPDESKTGGRVLQGREAQRAVARDLLLTHESHMPEDFKLLRAMLEKAMTT